MERVRIKDIAKMADVSVGTVDRVIHGRSGVSESSRKRVEEILKQLDYQPNMYASALASNKKYAFACLLPLHQKGEYWTEVEAGIQNAVEAYSDFNVTVQLSYYDPYNYDSFAEASDKILGMEPDGVMFAPTVPQHTKPFTDVLTERNIPYIYRLGHQRRACPLLLRTELAPKRIFCRTHADVACRRGCAGNCDFPQDKRGVVGSNQQERREVGFREYMQEHHPACHIWELDLHAKRDSEDAQMLDDFFREHPAVRSGITFNSKAYIIGEYLLKKRKKDFNLMGYDLLQRNVDCLKQGSIFFLIAQQPALQGFDGIKSLCEHLILRKRLRERTLCRLTC